MFSDQYDMLDDGPNNGYDGGYGDDDGGYGDDDGGYGGYGDGDDDGYGGYGGDRWGEDDYDDVDSKLRDLRGDIGTRVEYQETFGDKDRLSAVSIIDKLMETPYYNNGKRTQNMTRKDKFLWNTHVIASHVKETKIIDSGDYEKLMNMTTKIFVDYKNPCGWVLGYIYITYPKESKKLFTSSFLKNINMIGKLKGVWGVSHPDIIRYKKVIQSIQR